VDLRRFVLEMAHCTLWNIDEKVEVEEVLRRTVEIEANL
jgi:hypothetical protein